MQNITLTFDDDVAERIVAWVKKEQGDATADLDTVQKLLVRYLKDRIFKYEEHLRVKAAQAAQVDLRPEIN